MSGMFGGSQAPPPPTILSVPAAPAAASPPVFGQTPNKPQSTSGSFGGTVLGALTSAPTSQKTLLGS